MSTYTHTYGTALEVNEADHAALLALLPATDSGHSARIEPQHADCGCLTGFTVKHLDHTCEVVATRVMVLAPSTNITTRRHLMKLLMKSRMHCRAS